MVLSKEDICGLLPHTGAMCLLDAVQSWDGDEIECRAGSHRDPANPLRRAGVLPAVCLVEYVAQAIGVHGRLATGTDAKPAAGYLASLRDLVLHVERLDDIAEVLDIRARRLAASGESVMCEFSVGAAGRELARGRATLLLEVR
jgi:predicted hotdog family 3-hydroxylacyl-ACP dehydratase